MSKPLKILYIDQPLQNRGDESAHRGIISWLNANFPDATIDIIFWDEDDSNIQEFVVDSPLNRYINIKPVKGAHFALVNGLSYPILWHIHPTTRQFMKRMKKADYIICSPGGVNMGGFQGWEHIAMLKMGISTNTPVIYYGRSIGPFPTSSKSQIHFFNESVDLLKSFAYLSVRDRESASTLAELGIKHTQTVDCAFLNVSMPGIPADISSKLGEEYAVIVPNILYWHYAFKNLTHNDILDFYVSLFKRLMSKFPHLKFVMLPQTYGETRPERQDYLFFKEIENNVCDSRIIVLPETIGSDVQQSIVHNAKFLFGSRYHSVVFAINQSTPFVALSYEHKISGLLDLLNLKDQAIGINTQSFKPGDAVGTLIDECVSRIESLPHCDIHEATDRARTIAKDQIEELKQIIR